MVPRHASTLAAERGETTWELVALGDSTPTGYGVGGEDSYVQVYAGYIEDDLGIDVIVHNWATNETRTVADWVEVIRTNEELRDDLREAEVITMWLGWHDVVPSILVGRPGSCNQGPSGVDMDCLEEVTSPMKDGFAHLLSEIVSLASPRQTLILIADTGIPVRFVEAWKEDATFDVMQEHAYEVWREYILQAAGKHGARVANTYEAINGADGDRPLPPEYWQSDRVHFSQQGHELIADLHRELGYEYSRP
jgi:hypothetical protein